MDAAQALVLEELRGHRARLVVGDDELTVVVEVEPVDDAADADLVEPGLELELEADRPDRRRVLELEVAADELLGVGVEELPLGVGLSSRPVNSGSRGEVGPGAVEVRERGVEGALAARDGPSAARARGARACPCWPAADGGSGSRWM